MIFLDTGPLVAVVAKNDAFHQQAIAMWPRIAKMQAVTTNLVIVETANLLCRRIGGENTEKWIRELYRTTKLKVVFSNEDLELQALVVMSKMSMHRVGLADAVSFLVMNQNGIDQVATFDKHFKIAGYQPLNTAN